MHDFILFICRLEHFFREAYALTFGLKPGEKRKFEEVTSDVIMVMRTTLSKKEFASALGMKEGDLSYFLVFLGERATFIQQILFFFYLRASADSLISLGILSCHRFLYVDVLSCLGYTPTGICHTGILVWPHFSRNLNNKVNITKSCSVQFQTWIFNFGPYGQLRLHSKDFFLILLNYTFLRTVVSYVHLQKIFFLVIIFSLEYTYFLVKIGKPSGFGM